MLFDITFETITPESAEHGECADSGFYMEKVTLREAWEFLLWQGHCEESDSYTANARWLTFYGEPCFTTGAQVNYSLHFPEKLSQHSRLRIARLFGCYGAK